MPEIRVLIVDDQPLYRGVLADLLEVVGGYQVVGSAGTGEEAVELAARAALDLVFMDLRLPGMDGLAATSLIRAAPHPPAVVLMSTDLDALGREAVRESGAVDSRAKADLDPEWLSELRTRISGEPSGSPIPR